MPTVDVVLAIVVLAVVLLGLLLPTPGRPPWLIPPKRQLDLDYRALIVQADAYGWAQSGRAWRLAALEAGHDLEKLLTPPEPQIIVWRGDPSPPAWQVDERQSAYLWAADVLTAAGYGHLVQHTPDEAARINAEARARVLADRPAVRIVRAASIAERKAVRLLHAEDPTVPPTDA